MTGALASGSAAPAPQRTRRRAALTAAGALAVAAALGGVWLWRQRAPVEVRLASAVVGLNLAVSPEPARLSAVPGKMQRVVFQVHNPGPAAQAVTGSIAITPTSAEAQVTVFAMQCGEWTTIAPGARDTFAVVFSVAPAGLRGTRSLTLEHRFVPAEGGGGR